MALENKKAPKGRKGPWTLYSMKTQTTEKRSQILYRFIIPSLPRSGKAD